MTGRKNRRSPGGEKRPGKRGKRGAAAGMMAAALVAGFAAGASPACVYASSPEFARSAEEWAQLRDNKIEYSELPGLIEEYNATVQNNQYSYRKFREDYGDTNDEVSEEYYKLASDFIADMSELDTDTASGMSRELSLRIQADNMLKQASETLDDSRIYLLTYEKAKMSLVAAAQSDMIRYYTLLNQKRTQEATRDSAARQMALAELKKNAGMATELDILTAKQSFQDAEDRITQTERSIESLRESMNVRLGWKYGDRPEIGPVPAADVSRIADMNPEADLQKAYDNNYTLRINTRKRDNAKDGTTRENCEITLENNRKKIAASLSGAYRDVLTAELALQQAQAKAALEDQNLSAAGSRLAAGTITQSDYDARVQAAENARLSAESADLALFSAMETYDWNVNGLAAAE